MTDQKINNIDIPLVSIVITSYNRASFIEKAISSALAQDYPNLEIIISDNCSTDHTDEVIKKFLADPRLHYFENDANIGMIPNFQLATEQRARGKYITYVSSDDYLINNSFISTAIQIVNKYENVLLVFGKNMTYLEELNILIDDQTHGLYTKEFQEGKKVFLEFANTKSLGWGGVLMNKKEFESLNIFESKMTSLDYGANLFLMLKGNVGFIKQPSYVFRVHGNQSSTPPDADRIIENCDYIFAPYHYAKQHDLLPGKKLENWKNKLLAIEARSASHHFFPVNKKEYHKMISYFKINHPDAYKILRKDIKWNFSIFLLKRPQLTLKILKILSKRRYQILKNIITNSKAIGFFTIVFFQYSKWF
jgi:Glycosyltransferases involved in cell wall biogenesis